MELKDILKDEYFDENGCIQGSILELLLPQIQKSIEFRSCVLNTIKSPIDCGTSKLVDGFQLSGDYRLYSICQTPIIFEYKNWINTVNDGCSISPIIYDRETFDPKKQIILSFDPTDTDEKSVREKLHESLDKVIDNPEIYMMVGKKGLLIRGYFKI